MKKTFLGITVVAAALVLSGCGKPAAQNQNANQTQTQNQNQTNETEDSVISTIQDALSSGKKMECAYTTKIGDKEMRAVMRTDGKNFKTSSEFDGKTTYSVMKDEVSYTWGEGMPVAVKLAMNCAKDLPKGANGEAAPQVQDPEKAFDSAINVVCNPIATVDITVPNNVQFQDMCEMMKDMKDIKIPDGANMPNVPSMP